jgi:formylglycine-generating enzyme required for sulfatase activity
VLRRVPSQEPIPPAIVAEVAMQLCEGMTYAHTARDEAGQPLNLIHRDLKPGNVMITPDGVVKIMDFGVAKSTANLFQTQVGNITRGTPSYMSPEQVSGRTLDHRSDLFSLGSLLTELITGEKVFLESNRHQLLLKVQQADVGVALDRVGERMPQMVPVLRRALSRDRDQRYSSAAQMGREIARACSDLLGRLHLGHWLTEWFAEGEAVQGPADGPTDMEMPLENLADNRDDDGDRSLTIEIEPRQTIDPDNTTDLPIAHVSTTVRVPGGRDADPRCDIVMVRFEPGTYWMGSRDDLTDASPDEFLHRVALTRPFLVSSTVVTQAQWQTLMGSNPAWTKGDDLPVESIRWLDVIEFCNKLSEAIGFRTVYRTAHNMVSWDRAADGFRLLTEAEWEYVIRSGEEFRYAGSDEVDEVSWHWGNAEGVIQPVATKKPNRAGLYDGCGNVAEWVWDRYGPYPTQSVSTDPTGPYKGDMRVVRGGSCFSLPSDTRVAKREGQREDERYFFLGFRLARTIFGASAPGQDETEDVPAAGVPPAASLGKASSEYDDNDPSSRW